MIEKVRDRVATRLKELELNAAEVTRQAGIGRTYITDLLAGRSNDIQLSYLDKISKVLKCSVAYLCGESDKLFIDEDDFSSILRNENLLQMIRSLVYYSVQTINPSSPEALQKFVFQEVVRKFLAQEGDYTHLEEAFRAKIQLEFEEALTQERGMPS